MRKTTLPAKWQAEEKTIKAIQLAFDLDRKVQYIIRKEALEMEINPGERIRQILGLDVYSQSQRPRLSISLKPNDFVLLAKKYGVAVTDKKIIKQRATAEIQQYTEQHSSTS